MPDRGYSFARALVYLANPAIAATRDAAGVEINASEALEQAYGGAARGLIVPGIALTRQSTQTESDGGALVGQAVNGFAGALRAALVTGRAGATVLTDLRSDVSIPTLVSGATAHWLDEDRAAESDVTDSTPPDRARLNRASHRCRIGSSQSAAHASGATRCCGPDWGRPAGRAGP